MVIVIQTINHLSHNKPLKDNKNNNNQNNNNIKNNNLYKVTITILTIN